MILSAEEARKQLRHVMKSAYGPNGRCINPFEVETEIESLNTSHPDFWLDEAFGDGGGEDGSFHSFTLVLGDILILGGLRINICFSALSLMSSRVDGGLFVSRVVDDLDLRGAVISGPIDFSELKCKRIFCDQEDANRFHLAAPTIPLVC